MISVQDLGLCVGEEVVASRPQPAAVVPKRAIVDSDVWFKFKPEPVFAETFVSEQKNLDK